MNTPEQQTPQSQPSRHPYLRIIVLTAVVSLAIAFGATALLINIFQHKQEARNPFFRVVVLTDETQDPAVWGKNFPLQYDGYVRTVDMVRTRFGGSEARPRTPTDADPRSVVAQSRLEQDPRLRTMWAGYAFATDFQEERGHAYMLTDQLYTERQNVTTQPGTCLHCHASMYLPYRWAGEGNLIAGFEKLNQMPYKQAHAYISEMMQQHGQKLQPLSCLDCHDPQTMQLRITRPGFIEGIKVYKASQGVKDYDANTMATRQEMRSFICGQCHVEYYFRGAEKRLTYPWHKGLKADQILDYYEEVGFKDWVHADTGAPVLKAQHPEFEMWNQGTHARAGVACADCHMPYKRVGAMKISDHHVRSPLLNVSNACQTCHRVPEAELKARAETIQEKTLASRNLAMDALVALIGDIKSLRGQVPDEQLAPAQGFQRKAQFLLDFVEAENSMGFHADQEAQRLLVLSVDYSRQGQVALRDLWPARGKPPATQAAR